MADDPDNVVSLEQFRLERMQGNDTLDDDELIRRCQRKDCSVEGCRRAYD